MRSDGSKQCTPDRPRVEMVIPVHNEERILVASVRELHDFMLTRLAVPFRLTIAENASTDRTLALARELESELPEVRALHLERKGRGGALREAWTDSDADVLAYVDVDLSTDLSALPQLLAPLLAGTADVAIGTRLAPGARVTRSRKRELISRAYNIVLRLALQVGFSDAQCGFKAGRRAVIQPLLDGVRDDGWFFDTELLYLAQRGRLSIHEVPVTWVEDRDSRVAIVRTALEDLRGVRRLRRAERGAAEPASQPVPAGTAAGTA